MKCEHCANREQHDGNEYWGECDLLADSGLSQADNVETNSEFGRILFEAKQQTECG